MNQNLQTFSGSLNRAPGAKSGFTGNRFLPFLFLLAAMLGLQHNLLAQSTTLNTNFANNNGSGTTTFNLHNTNTYPIIITEVGGVTGASGTQTATLYYKTTPVNGAPGAIDATNGWTQAATGTFTGVANTTTSTAQPVITNMSFTIPAGATYGMAVSSPSFRYSTLPGGTQTIAAGGVNLITGDNIGYGGGTPPAAPTFTPRGFIGYLTFMPAVPCTAPPTGGQATSSVATVCPNTNFQLGLTGASGGTGMTYQWQSSPNGTTGWTNVTGAANANVTVTQTTTTFYRAQLTCSGQTATSAPVQVTTNATPVSGTFTINKGAAPSATNFQSFAAAIASIECGGANGPIVFNVVAGSGPYNEQVTIPVIPGTSATNTVTFNGNGNTLRGTSTGGTPVMQLDGADFIRVNTLTIETEATATTGQVVHLTNGADNNIFNDNTIRHVGSLGVTSTSHAIYIYTGSNNNNTFSNNTIIGGYYGVYNYGTAAAMQSGNQFTGNIFRDQYYYGIYNYYGPNALIEGNDFSRPSRTNGNFMYGIYVTTGSTGLTISKNRIHNTHDAASTTTGTVYGIYQAVAGTAGSENIIKNNAIYNINANGGSVYGFYNSGGNNTYYYHNTISADMPGVTYNIARGIHFASASTNVRFQNNNISLSSTATTKHAIYVASTSIALQSNGNNLYAPNGNVGYWTSNQATLANWRTASSQDAASVSADPLYVNMATGDLKPTNSTLNGIGLPLPAVTDDITGAPRSTTDPDAGAYEFVPAANDAGATAIISPTSPVIPNVSQPVQVTIRNFGSNPLTTATITWTINGTAQTPFSWTGNLANNQTANVTIGNYSFPAGNYTLNVCVTTINGQANANPGNDCFQMTVVSCNALTATYTIDKNSPASATNFQSFATAVNTLNSCGIAGPVVFNVVANTGPYLEMVEIMSIPGASATNTVTFNGNGNTLRGTSTAGVPTLKLDGADFIRFNNLTIETEATATAGQVVHLTNGADNNIFTGNTLRHAGSLNVTSVSHAIYIYTGSNNNNTFHNNTVIGGYYGVYNYGTVAAPHDNNRFTNNTFRDQYYYGIYNYYGSNSFIEGNDISRPTRTNGSFMYGIYAGAGSTGLTISKNRIHNTHDAATTLTGTVYAIYTAVAGTAGSENMIMNNAIYNINNNGGSLYAIYNSGGNNTYYYYNTISADMPGISYNILRGMYFLSASTNVRFINNNISMSSNATTKHAIYVGSTSISLQSNNNNLYAPAGNVGYFGANMVTLADWKLANSSAYDQASVSADPQYVNLATGDLKPTNVAINGAGQPLASVTDDITGAPRNATIPDPGAFEFSVSANDVGITAITGATSGCGLTASQSITVTVKNFGSSPQTNIPVNFLVNGTIVGTGTIPGPLAPNATVTHTFTTTANLGTPGPYTIVANTLMTGDADPSNNTFTLNVTNALIPTLPINLDFETPATGIGAVQVVTNSLSTITEDAGASNGTTSNKGMIMAGITSTNWQTPVGVVDPWTNNGNQFSAVYMCINPSGGGTDSLFLTFDLKQLFKTANANTNFRVTVNGQQVGPTYRPPFDPTNPATPIVWRRIRVDLTPYKNMSNVQIGLESSVKEEYAGGNGTANLIDNVSVFWKLAGGLKSGILAAQIKVHPNPSNGIFNVTAPKGNYTIEVTDMTGRTILKQTATGITTQLNLKDAAKGIYLMKMTSDGNVAAKRLVVE